MSPFALCPAHSTSTEAGSTGVAPFSQPFSATKETSGQDDGSELVPVLLAFFQARLQHMGGLPRRQDLPHLLTHRTLDRLGGDAKSDPPKDVVLRVALEELHGFEASRPPTS